MQYLHRSLSAVLSIAKGNTHTDWQGTPQRELFKARNLLSRRICCCLSFFLLASGKPIYKTKEFIRTVMKTNTVKKKLL